MTRLEGRHILITAGPTQEAIDPVRYIGNRSTGKMGAAIAESALKAGAKVTLVMGPSYVETSHGIERINVTSAQEMFEACLAIFPKVDAAILSAAVADYRPKQVASEKIKKKAEALTLELERTPDILASLGQQKGAKILVGFALETENELVNARTKLIRKNADMIVLNSLRIAGAGFGHDTNQVTLVRAAMPNLTFGLLPKNVVADEIIKHTAQLLSAK